MNSDILGHLCYNIDMEMIINILSRRYQNRPIASFRSDRLERENNNPKNAPLRAISREITNIYPSIFILVITLMACTTQTVTPFPPVPTATQITEAPPRSNVFSAIPMTPTPEATAAARMMPWPMLSGMPNSAWMQPFTTSIYGASETP